MQVPDAIDPTPDPLIAPLRRLRRRAIAARLVDAAVVGVTASILALGINLIMGSPGSPLLVFAIITLTIIAMPLVRLPTLAETAGRIDDENRLNELLSTAVLTHDSSDDWCRLIHRQAEGMLAQLPPQRFHTFGPRVHAACWLLAVAVLVTASIGRSTHSDDRDALAANGSIGGGPGRTTLTSLQGAGGQRAREAESAMRGANQINDPSAGRSASRPGSSGGSDARGAGRAETDTPSNDSAPRDLANRNTSQATGSSREGAGGDGRASESRGSNGPSNARGSVTAAPRQPVAPWQTDAWSQRRDAAQAAVDAGRIPDAYRDLVRDYFDR